MKWIKVTSELPKKDADVFVLVNNEFPYNANFVTDINMFCNDGLKVEDVTHWITVPELEEKDKIKLTEIPKSIF